MIDLVCKQTSPKLCNTALGTINPQNCQILILWLKEKVKLDQSVKLTKTTLHEPCGFMLTTEEKTKLHIIYNQIIYNRAYLTAYSEGKMSSLCCKKVEVV